MECMYVYICTMYVYSNNKGYVLCVTETISAALLASTRLAVRVHCDMYHSLTSIGLLMLLEVNSTRPTAPLAST